MSFASLNLEAPILAALTQCGYTEATPIQTQAIPRAIAGKDIIASAQTGTGKTAAFILPSLQKLATSEKSPLPRILVLTPTRELAMQVNDAVYKYGKNLHVKTASILGGMPYKEQLRQLEKRVDIIVATPGRLMDHMERGRVDLSGIEILILDEADRMLDMGFIDDVEYIAAAMPKNRQTLLFTATMDNKLAKLANKILRNPERIEVLGKTVTLDNIKQYLYVANDSNHKSRLLQHFLADTAIDKAIIFSGTKREADGLASELCGLGHEAGALHGDMNQHKRNRTITQMRNGKIRILVATDVAARGIDINDITHVFNYDLPKFAEDYVHRIGRTGRAGKSGIAISLATARDAKALKQIERFTGQNIARKTVEGMEPSKQNMDDSRQKPQRSRGEKSFGSRRPEGGRRFEGRGQDNRFSERRSDGSFRTPRTEGSFKPRGEGGFKPRSEGSFKPRSEGSFRPRNDGPFKPRSEGRFEQRSEGRAPARGSRFDDRFGARSERFGNRTETRLTSWSDSGKPAGRSSDRPFGGKPQYTGTRPAFGNKPRTTTGGFQKSGNFAPTGFKKSEGFGSPAKSKTRSSRHED